MANPFVKGWKYLMALFDSKLDERADPKVQIQQAMETAQRQHQALLQQAAAVIGNQRQLEMKLSRQLTEVEQLQAQARQTLTLADQARAGGDTAKADELERTAQTFAAGLVAAESSLQDLKQLHDQALSAAAQARDAVKNSDMLLKQKEAERMKLLSQLEQAKMQETMARSLESVNNLAVPANSPSLDEVRDKIERRYAMALGRSDLAKETVEGRRLEVQRATIDLAGAARLAEIRASMASEAGAVPGGGKAAIGEAAGGAAAIGGAGRDEAGRGGAAGGAATSDGAASGAAIKASEETPPADTSRS